MTENIQNLANKAWNLSRDGNYEEAINLYSTCFEKDGMASHLFGRAMSYFEKGNYLSALDDFQYLIQYVKPEFIVDDYYIYQGICYWYLGEPSQVVPTWEKGLTAPFTDAAGGVILPSLILYASARMNDARANSVALQLLKKYSKRNLKGWPGPIAPFLIGKVDIVTLKSSLDSTSSLVLHSRWQCQADFYIGLSAYINSDNDMFRSAIFRCSKNPYGYYEVEYFLAKWEVEQGFPEPAFPK